MSWTAVYTFTVGAILTAAQLNTYLRDNTSHLHGDGGEVDYGVGPFKFGGQVGVNVVPAAWSSAYAVQVRSNSYLTAALFDSVDGGGVVENAYHDGTNWRAIYTNGASKFATQNAAWKISYAASTTAGSVISWVDQISGSSGGVTVADKFTVSQGAGMVVAPLPTATSYTAISLWGTLAAVGDFNFASSASDKTLYINRPSSNNISFRINNATEQGRMYASGGFFWGTPTGDPGAGNLQVQGSGTFGSGVTLTSKDPILFNTNQASISYESSATAYALDLCANYYVTSGAVGTVPLSSRGSWYVNLNAADTDSNSAVTWYYRNAGGVAGALNQKLSLSNAGALSLTSSNAGPGLYLLHSGAIPNNNDNAAFYMLLSGSGPGFRVRTDQANTSSYFGHVLVNNSSATAEALRVENYGTGEGSSIANYHASFAGDVLSVFAGRAQSGAYKLIRGLANTNASAQLVFYVDGSGLVYANSGVQIAKAAGRASLSTGNDAMAQISGWGSNVGAITLGNYYAAVYGDSNTGANLAYNTYHDGTNFKVSAGSTGGSFVSAGGTLDMVVWPNTLAANTTVTQGSASTSTMRFSYNAGSPYFAPATDNQVSFGASGLRATAVWAANGTIQTSDPDQKQVLRALAPNEALKVLRGLKAYRGHYLNPDGTPQTNLVHTFFMAGEAHPHLFARPGAFNPATVATYAASGVDALVNALLAKGVLTAADLGLTA